jgi:hypothetical protein
MSESTPPRPPHVGVIPIGEWFGLSAKLGARILAGLRLPDNEPGQVELARELLAEMEGQGGRVRTSHKEARKLILIAETLRRVDASEEAACDILDRPNDPRRARAEEMLSLIPKARMEIERGQDATYRLTDLDRLALLAERVVREPLAQRGEKFGPHARAGQFSQLTRVIESLLKETPNLTAKELLSELADRARHGDKIILDIRENVVSWRDSNGHRQETSFGRVSSVMSEVKSRLGQSRRRRPGRQ